MWSCCVYNLTKRSWSKYRYLSSQPSNRELEGWASTDVTIRQADKDCRGYFVVGDPKAAVYTWAGGDDEGVPDVILFKDGKFEKIDWSDQDCVLCPDAPIPKPAMIRVEFDFIEEPDPDPWIEEVLESSGYNANHICSITLGSYQRDLARLFNPDEIVIPMRYITVKISYPLAKPELFLIFSDTTNGFTRAGLVKEIVKTYHCLGSCLKSLDDLELVAVVRTGEDEFQLEFLHEPGEEVPDEKVLGEPGEEEVPDEKVLGEPGEEEVPDEKISEKTVEEETFGEQV